MRPGRCDCVDIPITLARSEVISHNKDAMVSYVKMPKETLNENKEDLITARVCSARAASSSAV